MSKGIEIHIHLGGAYNPPTPERPKNLDADKAAELDMRLMSRDTLEQNEMDQLSVDVINFAKDMVDRKEYEELRLFLEKATHHLTPDLRDILSEMLGGIK